MSHNHNSSTSALSPQSHTHHVSLPALLEHEAELPASHHHSEAEFEEDEDAVLPIVSFENEILRAIRSTQIVIIIGETGSGKTTQIPQIIAKYAGEFLEREKTIKKERESEIFVKREKKKTEDEEDEERDRERKRRRWDNEEREREKVPLKMAITQPRRIAAISVAQRVAEEYEQSVLRRREMWERDGKREEEDGTTRDPSMESSLSLGGTVGYTVRFDDCTSSQTRLKFMTDGILIRECLSDPLLSQYSLIMLDEAHERSLNTDILFGLLKQVCEKRQDLKVVVTSATLDADKFGAYFNNCPIIQIPGRLFPVDIYHSKTKQIMTLSGPANNSYVQSAVDIVLKIHRSKEEGHILVFMTGSDEIEKVCFLLNQALREEREDAQRSGNRAESERELLVLPLYSALSNDEQVKVFQKTSILYEQKTKTQRRSGIVKPPALIRKVVVSTNIAETSITVPHVRYVIDAGYVKQKVFDPSRGIESLVVVPVSKIAALQRAGRAGRTGPGQCYRLYSSECFDNFLDETIPEIQRTNLANTILYLKALGVHDVLSFDFLDPPSPEQVLQALTQLHTLQAISDTGEITPIGRKMSSFPLDPHLSRILLESGSALCQCVDEMVIVLSMLCVENVWNKPRNTNKFQKEFARKTPAGKDAKTSQGAAGHYGPASREDESGASSRANTLTRLTVEEERCEIAHAALRHEYGDFLTYWNVFRAFEKANYSFEWCERNFVSFRSLKTAKKIREHLAMDARKARLHELNSSLFPERAKDKDSKKKDKVESLEKRMCHAITAGFFMNAATRCTNDSVYKCLPLVDKKQKRTQSELQLVHMHPQSAFAVNRPSEFVVYQELVHSTKLFMKTVGRVSERVLAQHQRQWHFVDANELNGRPAACSGEREKSAPLYVKAETSAGDVESGAASHADKKARASESDEKTTSGEGEKALSAVELAKLRYLSRKSGK